MNGFGQAGSARRAAVGVVLGAGIALVGLGGLATAAVAASAPTQGAISTSVARTGSGNPSPNQQGWMMGGPMMGDDDWNWHQGSMMSRWQARQAARAWVATHHRGATTSQGTRVHGGYRFRIIRHGTALGRVTVNTTTGHCAWYRY